MGRKERKLKAMKKQFEKQQLEQQNHAIQMKRMEENVQAIRANKQLIAANASSIKKNVAVIKTNVAEIEELRSSVAKFSQQLNDVVYVKDPLVDKKLDFGCDSARATVKVRKAKKAIIKVKKPLVNNKKRKARNDDDNCTKKRIQKNQRIHVKRLKAAREKNEEKKKLKNCIMYCKTK